MRCDKGGYVPTDERSRSRPGPVSTPRARDKGFGNGRLARNLFEAAVARQASRVVAIDDPTDAELTDLTAADIPRRRATPCRPGSVGATMKRLGALLGAVAMVVGGLRAPRRAHRRRRHRRPRATGPAAAAAPPSSIDLCERVEPGRRSVPPPARTADRLIGRDRRRRARRRGLDRPRGLGRAGHRRAATVSGRPPLFEVAGAPLASSGVVLAIWADRADAARARPAPTVDWRCLAASGRHVACPAATASRPGMPGRRLGHRVSPSPRPQAAVLLGTSDFAANDFDGDVR